MPDDGVVESKDKDLLKRIRDRYRYGMDKWRKIREEGQKNIRYVSGDPWDDADKEARKGRPTVCADELNQYVNQVVNTARMSPRGIKIDPAGDDATDELAEYRENRIRAIEYACNASQAYLNGLQAVVERNMGYWKVSRAYVADDSDEQEILILPIMNPDSIVIDPDYKELDGSDIKWCFELDRMRVDEFLEEYPDAEQRSFSADDFVDCNGFWYDGDYILVASYWEIQKEEQEIGKNKRKKEVRTGVKQYVTNGFEILKRGAVQPGPYIPIVPVFGKELWVDTADGGGGSERFLLSLVSLARDAQKALAYVMSSMLENVGQLPKTSFIGWKGQFESDAEAWATMNQVFHPFLQLDPGGQLDGDGAPMAPLGWAKSTPDFSAYSVGTDICRRAIQAAMGISPLPTAAQRQNQKSGVALEKIQSQQSVGSYHLVDAYDRAIKLTGRIVNGWLAETDLGETTRPVRLADGKHQLVQINTDEPVEVDGHQYHFPIADDKGRYQVTVSTGPSSDSQRDEAKEFTETLIQNLKGLPIAPPQMAKILAIAVKMRQLGPMGDQLADIISPQDNGPQQQLAQIQQQSAAMHQQMQEMSAVLQKLTLEKQGKVIEGQTKLQITELQNAQKMADGDKDRAVKLAIAEVSTKAQDESERRETFNDVEMQLHSQAHEAAMQAVEHEHQGDMATQNASQQADLQAQQADATSQQSAQDADQQQAAQPQE